MFRLLRSHAPLLISVAACLAASCGGKAADAREQLRSFKCVGHDSGKCVLFGPSVTDLVVRPDAYQNLPIQVRGYLSNEFEDEFLYPDAATYEQYQHQYAIRLSLPLADRAKYDQFRGKYVQLEGTFRGFAISEIARVEMIGTSTRGRKVPAPPPLSPAEIPRR